MTPLAARAWPSSFIVRLAAPRPCHDAAERLYAGQLTGSDAGPGTEMPFIAWHTMVLRMAACVGSAVARYEPRVKPPSLFRLVAGPPPYTATALADCD